MTRSDQPRLIAAAIRRFVADHVNKLLDDDDDLGRAKGVFKIWRSDGDLSSTSDDDRSPSRDLEPLIRAQLQVLTARRLASGCWYVKGLGSRDFSQPPEWPCSEVMFCEHTFSWASDEFIKAALSRSELLSFVRDVGPDGRIQNKSISLECEIVGLGPLDTYPAVVRVCRDGCRISHEPVSVLLSSSQ